MNDTHPEMAVKIREMIRNKTAEERLAMGCSMYDFSKRLVIASILQRNPGLTPDVLRREVFLRFYGNDFKRGEQEKVIDYLSKVKGYFR